MCMCGWVGVGVSLLAAGPAEEGSQLPSRAERHCGACQCVRMYGRIRHAPHLCAWVCMAHIGTRHAPPRAPSPRELLVGVPALAGLSAARVHSYTSR